MAEPIHGRVTIDPACKIIFKVPDLNYDDLNYLTQSRDWIRRVEGTIEPLDDWWDVDLVGELVLDTDLLRNSSYTTLLVQGQMRWGMTASKQDSLRNTLGRWLEQVHLTDDIGTWLLSAMQPKQHLLRQYKGLLETLPSDHALVKGWNTGVFRDIRVVEPITGRIPMKQTAWPTFTNKF